MCAFVLLLGCMWIGLGELEPIHITKTSYNLNQTQELCSIPAYLSCDEGSFKIAKIRNITNWKGKKLFEGIYYIIWWIWANEIKI